MQFFDEKEFRDMNMYREIVSFAKKEQQDGGNHILTSINKNLTPLLKNLTLDDLRDEWLTELDARNLISSGSRALICRFLGFIMQKGLIVGNKLSRISECKVVLYRTVSEGQLKLLLTTDIYDKYKEMNDLTENAEVLVLLRVANRTNNLLVDAAIEEYTNELKLSNDLSTSTKSARLSATNGLIQGFFGVIKIHKLTKSELSEYINSPDFSKDYIYPLLEILVIINEKELISDSLLKHYLTEVGKVYRKCNQSENQLVAATLDLLPSFTESSRLFLRVKDEKSTHLSRLLFFEIEDYDTGTLLGNYFMQSRYTSKAFKDFFHHFQNSIENQKFDSLTFKLFENQIKYYRKNIYDSETLRHLINFYKFLLQEEVSIFPDITAKQFLNRRGLSKELYDGFDIVFYQPLEDTPKSDKWIISYNEQQCTNEGINMSMTYRIDFTGINNKKYKYALKHYIWNQDSSINNKQHQRKYILDFLMFCEEYQKNKVIEISGSKSKGNRITLGLLIGYKYSVLQKYSNNRTILSHIYSARNFLRHSQENNLLIIDKGFEYYLSHTRDTTYNNPQPVKKNHMNEIFEELKNNSDKSVNDMLYMSIFYLLSVTELRISNILALRKNCIRKIGTNEYIILTETKTSNKEMVEIPVIPEVKEQIDIIIKVTEQYRKESENINANKFLFLTKGSFLNQYNVLSIQNFNRHLKEICVELGFPKYTASNLRDTHMTNIENFIIESNYSELYQNTLSGHKSSAIDEQHYVKIDKREALTAVRDVRIGSDIDADLDRFESNQTNSSIKFNKILTSHHFITTTEFLSYFNNKISEVDDKILMIDEKIDTTRSIDRLNKLINYRELLTGYREEILNVKQDKEGI